MLLTSALRPMRYNAAIDVTLEGASPKRAGELDGTAAVPEGRVVKRHSATTRLTHWIVALAILILIMSGFQIFNAAPYLDPSDLSNPHQRILSIGTATSDQTVGTTTLFGHTFTTTNWLGYTDDGQGHQTARAFPGWITFPGYQDLGSGRARHFFFRLGSNACGHRLSARRSRPKGSPPSDLAAGRSTEIASDAAVHLRLRKEPPDRGKYNRLQKAGYTVVLFGLFRSS